MNYLLKIKNIVDRLASVGHIVSSSDHIEAIFNGLSEEYDTFIISVNSRTEDYTVEEIEALLLAQEGRIEKHSKELDSYSGSINLATQDSQHRKYYKGGRSIPRQQHPPHQSFNQSWNQSNHGRQNNPVKSFGRKFRN